MIRGSQLGLAMRAPFAAAAGLLALALAGCLTHAQRAPAPAPTPLDELLPLQIGGVRQWLLVRAEDANLPVLLFVHGGPGSTLLPFSRAFDGELVKRFVVVHWDQRQAGKSFDPAATEALTIARYVDDCLEVLAYLRTRFGGRKTILVGHSWGSVIGLLTAARSPAGLTAYVGVGQVIDVRRSQELAYAWSLARAREQNPAQFAALEQLGAPPYADANGVLTLSTMLTALGGAFLKVTPADLDHAMAATPDYSDADRQHHGQGALASFGALKPELEKFIAAERVAAVALPVWFIHGDGDRVCDRGLVEAYLGALQAPAGKLLVVMPGCGHFPFWDDPAGFAAELVKIADSLR